MRERHRLAQVLVGSLWLTTRELGLRRWARGDTPISHTGFFPVSQTILHLSLFPTGAFESCDSYMLRAK